MLLISLLFILITFLILFLIKRIFDNFTFENIHTPFKLNIKSGKIIILSKKSCPWCEKLDPFLHTAKNEYIKIAMNDDNTFTFDEKFVQLDQKERESIIKGLKDLMDNIGSYFPTIIRDNKYILGFPEEETLNKILNE
tara:strand:+ start:5608 stop:6021 length:414 start_codon:yes stop_codon:yes gene_type:complete